MLKAGRGTTKAKTYFLNEPQATLLLTFLRNNEIVVEFKVDLVKVFYEMRMKLQNHTPSQKLSLSETVAETEIALKLIDLLKESKGFDLLLLEKVLKESSPTKLLEIDFSQTYFLPTELGQLLGISPHEMNLLLEKKGFQVSKNGVWKITESGKSFGMEIGGKFSQLKWRVDTIL